MVLGEYTIDEERFKSIGSGVPREMIRLWEIYSQDTLYPIDIPRKGGDRTIELL